LEREFFSENLPSSKKTVNFDFLCFALVRNRWQPPRIPKHDRENLKLLRSIYTIRQIVSHDTVFIDTILSYDTLRCHTTQFSLIYVVLCKLVGKRRIHYWTCGSVPHLQGLAIPRVTQAEKQIHICSIISPIF
jgi:hypothetical protein